MLATLNIALAQIGTRVGDPAGNAVRIGECCSSAAAAGADIVLFPEMCLTGYPPEDLLLDDGFTRACAEETERLAKEIGDTVAVVGTVERKNDLYNTAAVMGRGELLGTYHKRYLPNYGVFDERRYFGTGNSNLVIDIDGFRAGITICEDIWFCGGPLEEQVSAGGAVLILNLSASPFHRGKYEQRRRLIEARCVDGPVIVAYANAVGAQDELVFDGGSCVYHPVDGMVAEAQRFNEELLICTVGGASVESLRKLTPAFRHSSRGDRPVELITARTGRRGHPVSARYRCSTRLPLSPEREVLSALELGLREYMEKNGFSTAVLGLSGGIDSALVAAIAVEALGAANVVAVFMPSRFTSVESREAAEELAGNLGVKMVTLPIDTVMDTFFEVLSGETGEGSHGEWRENLQARIRGDLLMALSNRWGWLVLATGNKSELSMGYCTLYGDMAGGFALIKDLLKTWVYRLADFINREAGTEVIPASVIERPPTAELREGQLDTDSLPRYEELDPVLERYVELCMDEGQLAAAGADPELAREVAGRVDANEYKRRQAPVGVKITPRAFGRDRRMPISSFHRRAVRGFSGDGR